MNNLSSSDAPLYAPLKIWSLLNLSSKPRFLDSLFTSYSTGLYIWFICQFLCEAHWVL